MGKEDSIASGKMENSVQNKQRLKTHKLPNKIQRNLRSPDLHNLSCHTGTHPGPELTDKIFKHCKEGIISIKKAN